MAKFLYRVGRAAYAHRWRFIAVWLLIVVGVGIAAATLSKPTSTSFSIPGLESIETQDKLAEKFPGSGDQLEAPSGQVVMQAPEGKKLSDPDVQKQVASFVDDLKKQPYLANPDKIVDPATGAMAAEQQLAPAKEKQGLPKEQIDADIQAMSPLSEDGRTGIVQVTFDAPTSTDIEPGDLTTFKDVAAEHQSDDLEIAYAGNAFQTQEMSGSAEIIGIIVAALVLIITFGSFVAAGMPLLTGVTGVGIGIAGVTAATAFTDTINSMTPTLASMIGLAVGIDYALFIVSRFRSELIKHVDGYDISPKELAQRIKGLDRRERAHIAGMAVGKAGSAVVFAGSTVVIALVALMVINIPFLTAMALAAAVTVVIAVLVALTLLPAILGAFGTKVFAGRAPFVKAPDPENEKPTVGLRWVRQVRKRPTIFAIGVAVVLVLLAIPAAQLRLAMPSDGSMKEGSPNRIAYDMISEGFGPGRNAPMVALVENDGQSPEEAQKTWATAVTDLQSIDGVANAQLGQPSPDGSAAQIMITPEVGATDERAADVLSSIRDGEGRFHEETGATYSVTGASPIFEDISERLSSVLIPYIAIVLVLAFLLLMVVFRSILVPLVAALGFALSVAATFGITVALWQEGWGGIISDPQPIISFLPIMLIGLVFGLAMDYQVFLVSRMREGYVHGKAAGNAVANGFKHGARVVTAAALIMISVFAAFMLMDEPFIKVMGFALAAAVLLDAFLIRMTLVPAVMFLLGDSAWKLPKWLDKIVPRVDVEGETLVEVEDELWSKKRAEPEAVSSGAEGSDPEGR
ncbi:MMPL family transporter [Dietzia sp.]|uniref:MMPL family transporter n=1 Tax=Dietzia sp. TaxID=1871616 RepID=UPI002FDB07E5